MDNLSDALRYHLEPRPGKIEVVATKPLVSQRDLSLAYTPGVAEACRAIHANPSDAFKYTARGNLVAVVTNGTAVLGLGDIGPLAAKPVMEGKANLFKKFADIDVFDIELDASTVEEVVAAVKAMAPTFGGINLEDIKAPECFEIERQLQEALDIPVFHDDQHGTAIISAAGLLNALALTGRTFADALIVFSGAGAAALACARLYMQLGANRENIIICDSKGVLHHDRTDLNSTKEAFATRRPVRTLRQALVGADCFVGLSVADAVDAEMLMGMAPNPIVFAMANPDPEIPYELARRTRPDAIVATGRSDHPNQVNNVLGFPFVFRGALDCRARKVTDEMKIAATHALADLTRQDVPDDVLRAYGLDNLAFGPEYIIPKPFDSRVLLWVAPAVAEAAAKSGVAREPIADLKAYREWLHRLVERSRGLMHPLFERARNHKPKRILFTDGANPTVIRAAQILVEEGICEPILSGNAEVIRSRAEAARIELKGVEVHNRTETENDELATFFWEQRNRKGVTMNAARALLRGDPAYHASMMLRLGRVEGVVGGPSRPYKYTLRPALRILGKEHGSQIVSGVYVILWKDRHFFIGDCTVNIEPNAEELAEIALNTARVAETFGVRPRVAMLSYSDFGEHRRDPQVQRVRAALDIVRARRPDLEVDGEMQADTALNWAKLSEGFPFTTLTGTANVLVCPDLQSGNISYKLLENLAGAEALGPLLVGVGAPVNVAPLFATTAAIVNVATYTVNQAIDRG